MAAQRARGATPVRSAPDAGRSDAGRSGGPSRADLAAHRTRLRGIAEPVINDAGFDLDNLAVTRAGRAAVVRVIVDGDGGFNLDEIARLSRDVSAAIDEAEQAA